MRSGIQKKQKPASSLRSAEMKRRTPTPCCSKEGLKRGPWTPEEDSTLSNFIDREGEGRWRTLPKRAGLLRCGKSCRLRWMNYLRPSIKHGPIAPDEEDLILRLHRLLGNRWSLIAGRIPGRTDNEIKNYWNIHLSKKLISQGIDPRTHRPLNPDSSPAVNTPIPYPSPNPNPEKNTPIPYPSSNPNPKLISQGIDPRTHMPFNPDSSPVNTPIPYPNPNPNPEKNTPIPYPNPNPEKLISKGTDPMTDSPLNPNSSPAVNTRVSYPNHNPKKLISQGIDPRTDRHLNSHCLSAVNTPIPYPNPNPNGIGSSRVVTHLGHHGSHSGGLDVFGDEGWQQAEGFALQGGEYGCFGDQENVGMDCCTDEEFSLFLDSLTNDEIYLGSHSQHHQQQNDTGNNKDDANNNAREAA